MVCNSFHILDTARTVFTTETISVRPVFRSINFSSMVPAHITLMTVEPASTSSPASPARRLPQPRHWLRLQEQAGKWKSGTWSFWFLFTFHPYVTVTSHKVSLKFTPQPSVPKSPLSLSSPPSLAGAFLLAPFPASPPVSLSGPSPLLLQLLLLLLLLLILLLLTPRMSGRIPDYWHHLAFITTNLCIWFLFINLISTIHHFLCPP